MLFNKTLELEQNVKYLEESKKIFDITCSELSKRSIDLFAQINELKEHENKSLSLLAQKNVKLKKITTLDKEERVRRNLGFSSRNFQSPTYIKWSKNAFTKGESKTNVFLQAIMYGGR